MTKTLVPNTRFVTVPMPDALYAEAKTRATEDERTLVSIIRLALREYLERQGVTGEE